MGDPCGERLHDKSSSKRLLKILEFLDSFLLFLIFSLISIVEREKMSFFKKLFEDKKVEEETHIKSSLPKINPDAKARQEALEKEQLKNASLPSVDFSPEDFSFPAASEEDALSHEETPVSPDDVETPVDPNHDETPVDPDDKKPSESVSECEEPDERHFQKYSFNIETPAVRTYEVLEEGMFHEVDVRETQSEEGPENVSPVEVDETTVEASPESGDVEPHENQPTSEPHEESPAEVHEMEEPVNNVSDDVSPILLKQPVVKHEGDIVEDDDAQSFPKPPRALVDVSPVDDGGDLCGFCGHGRNAHAEFCEACIRDDEKTDVCRCFKN